MKISLVRKVKVPTRGTEQSAGIDFYVPEDFEPKNLYWGDTVLVPSGVKVKIPKNHVLIGFNKSGIATKLGLQIGACVIDEDYQGEIHIHLTRVLDGKCVTIEPGMKIAQFVLLPVVYESIDVVSIEDLYDSETERGEGGFGSTDKK